MTLNGQPVDRLTLVKAAANDFIAQRKGDRLGLILFGSKAYLQTPLTFDHTTVADMLADASIGLAGVETAMGDAMGLAIKELTQNAEKDRILILLTDGGNNAGQVQPLEAARLAAQNHIRIYTIGLGASALVINSLLGPQVINPVSDLDQDVLKTIAKQTGGLYFRAANAEDLYQVYQTMDQIEPVAADAGRFHPVTPLYAWPLAVALLLSGWLAIRKLPFTLRGIISKGPPPQGERG
jgi:Ca-activated chloride channel family protein